MSKVYIAATNKDFSKELAGFNFNKELVSYKSKTPEQICKDIFWPSFGEILRDFDVIIKCVACYAFAKKKILIALTAKKIFEFENFQEEQVEQEFINAGIPCATLYANLVQGTSIQEKIFEEIACGLIKILFITPKKLVLNEGFSNIIQKAGHAGSEHQETASIIANINIEEQRLINKLEHAARKIFKLNEQKPPTCEICDNCINQITDKPKLLDSKEEIIKLLKVVEYLTQETGEQIGPDDVIDVFRGGKTAKIKQKNWNTLPVYPTEKKKDTEN
ncbi:hypothetical protein C1645_880575 [Glomus cerebriforme]|uniref:RQC domain-containing protein n=1 Tax=Glomus cerebriforme TaxID=658196 RepID=A0A397SCV0_9GLOM|nr:hypothetical protein C1645_880575 [Glomus cerebriforme]